MQYKVAYSIGFEGWDVITWPSRAVMEVDPDARYACARETVQTLDGLDINEIG